MRRVWKKIFSIAIVTAMLMQVSLSAIPSMSVEAAGGSSIDWSSDEGWTVDGDNYAKAEGISSKRLSRTTYEKVDISGSLSFDTAAAANAGITVYAPEVYNPHAEGYSINWDFTPNVKQISVIQNGTHVSAPVPVEINQGESFDFRVNAENGKLKVWHGDMTGDPIIEIAIDTNTPGYVGTFGNGGASSFTDVTFAPTATPIDWEDGGSKWKEIESGFTNETAGATITRLSKATYDSVEMSGTINLKPGAVGGGVSLFTDNPHTPHRDGYAIDWNAGAKRVFVVNNGVAVSGSHITGIDITPGEAFQFKVKAEAGNLKVWHKDIEGDPIIDIPIDASASGYVATFANGATGTCEFQNMVMGSGVVKPPVEVANTNLSGITLDGIEMGNFDKTTTDFIVPIPQNTEALPVVGTVTEDINSNVEIVQATKETKKATITVTAVDGTTTKDYTVEFKEITTNMSGWHAIKPGYHIDGTTLVGDGAGNPDTHAYPVLAYMTQTEKEDLTIEADITLGGEGASTEPGDHASQGGFVIRSGEPNQYGFENSYVVMMHYNPNYGGSGKVFNEVAIWRFNNNVNASVIAANDKVALSLEESYNFKTTVKGNKISVYLNDEKVLETEDTLHDVGNVGVFRNGVGLGQRVTFDNIILSEPQDDNAKLADLKVGDATVAEFDGYKYYYNVGVESLDTLPRISATPENPDATVEVVQATKENPKAVVTVTAADGLTTKIYTVEFRLKVLAGKLDIRGPQASVEMGAPFKVAISATEVNAMTANDVSVLFDSSKLTFVRAELSDLAKSSKENVVAIDARVSNGEVAVATTLTGPNAWMSDGDYIILTFMPIDKGETQVQLSPTSEIANIYGDVFALNEVKSTTVNIGETTKPPVDPPEDIVDKTVLVKLYETYDGYQESKYTADSWAKFQSALDEAVRLIADKDATQAEVDAATRVLETAVAGLVEKTPTDPGTENPGTDDPGTDDPGTDDPGTDDPGTDDPGTDDPGTGSPGTGNQGANNSGTTPSNPTIIVRPIVQESDDEGATITQVQPEAVVESEVESSVGDGTDQQASSGNEQQEIDENLLPTDSGVQAPRFNWMPIIIIVIVASIASAGCFIFIRRRKNME